MGLNFRLSENMISYRFFKRALDVLGSLVLIVLTTPLAFSIVVFAIILQGFPVLFLQIRPGLKGKNFTIVKFRTMVRTDDGEENITPFGAVLRRLSLDELPQLINILRGEMSFVGPRPLLPEYMARYSIQQARRHNVRPGLTGLAQVNGRNLLGWKERLALDVTYVEQHSFFLDIGILWKTFIRVFTGTGVQPSGSTLMSQFERDEHPNPMA